MTLLLPEPLAHARVRSVWSHSISQKQIAGYGLLDPVWRVPQCVCTVPLCPVCYEALLSLCGTFVAS
eukprot:14392-Heterococcus_DN1.PRE.1